jgi:hypothetical protein
MAAPAIPFFAPALVVSGTAAVIGWASSESAELADNLGDAAKWSAVALAVYFAGRTFVHR